MTTGEYKRFKGLTKQNLRDNMINIELALTGEGDQGSCTPLGSEPRRDAGLLGRRRRSDQGMGD
jgi:hypothetical protein